MTNFAQFPLSLNTSPFADALDHAISAAATDCSVVADACDLANATECEITRALAFHAAFQEIGHRRAMNTLCNALSVSEVA